MRSNDFDALRQRIKGPVYPIPPAFHDDYSIDFKAVARYVDFLNSHHVRTLLVTAGTSRFNLLTETEVQEFNQCVVEANRGRALAIVGNPMTGSTTRAIDFAHHAESIGADAMLVYYPERFYTNERVFDYYNAIAHSTSIGLLIHGIPMRNAYAGITPQASYTVSLCELLTQIDNIVGMKEETGNESLRYKLAVKFKERMPLIVSAASMRKYLSCVLFGVDAYLVGIGNFVPAIEEKFYEAIVNKDFETALDIVVKYEDPFFDVAFPMGWHIAMKGAMELLGLMPATERPPLQPASQSEREIIEKTVTKLGWLKDVCKIR